MLCGLSRLSPRSLLAVATFFPTAALTFHLSHDASTPLSVCLNGSSLPCYTPTYPSSQTTARLLLLAAATLTTYHLLPRYLASSSTSSPPKTTAAHNSTTYLTGVTFGLGLLASGMASPAKVLAFFAFSAPARWDPSLALVILFGIVPSAAQYWVRGTGQPPAYADSYQLPRKGIRETDWRFVVGAALFGVAWGLSGVCPGPGILRAVGQPVFGVLWMSGFWAGSLVV